MVLGAGEEEDPTARLVFYTSSGLGFLSSSCRNLSCCHKWLQYQKTLDKYGKTMKTFSDKGKVTNTVATAACTTVFPRQHLTIYIATRKRGVLSKTEYRKMD